jgi:S-adenosylmethionine synthetase
MSTRRCCAEAATPGFGGGSVTEPIRIFLAGRTITAVGKGTIPIEDIAVEGSRAWLKANLHALDPERHVRIETLVRPGSQDLQSLFSRGEKDLPLANDTSFGVGHAPLSALERVVLAVEQRLHNRDRANDRPAWGEDIKIMAIRHGEHLDLTIACALIGRFLAEVDSYLDHKAALAAWVRERASEHGFGGSAVAINAADEFGGGRRQEPGEPRWQDL